MSRDLQTLAADDVRRIHEILVYDFAQTNDPISPPGLRSNHLLESAVHRQHTGFGQIGKYTDPVSNAATLTYGLCNDHPFYNGNKRTALVAMLVHLEKNGLCLRTSESDLFNLMKEIASHSLGLRKGRRRHDKELRKTSDEEVRAIADWISDRKYEVKRGERPLTFRGLRRILSKYGFELENPHSNAIDIVKVTTRTTLFRGTREERKRIGSIGYRDEGTEVSLKDIKSLRRMCHLSESDGVPADAFYGDADVVDAFVNKYRNVLRRLART